MWPYQRVTLKLKGRRLFQAGGVWQYTIVSTFDVEDEHYRELGRFGFFNLESKVNETVVRAYSMAELSR